MYMHLIDDDCGGIMDSSAFAQMMTSEKSENIIYAISRVTDALADLFGSYVQGKVLVELMQRSVLKNALLQLEEEHQRKGIKRKVSLTEMGLKTGFDTRTIRRASETPMRATEDKLSAEVAILQRWAKDPALRSSVTGKPADLPIYGIDGSFEGLVVRYAGRGISVRYVLQRLEEQGCIEVYNKNWVKLIDPNWGVFADQEDTFLSFGVNSILALIDTIKHNLKNKQDGNKKWVERRRYSWAIPRCLLPKVEAELNLFLAKCSNEAGHLMRAYEVDKRLPECEVIGVGFYFWRDNKLHTVNLDKESENLCDEIMRPYRSDCIPEYEDDGE